MEDARTKINIPFSELHTRTFSSLRRSQFPRNHCGHSIESIPTWLSVVAAAVVAASWWCLDFEDVTASLEDANQNPESRTQIDIRFLNFSELHTRTFSILSQRVRHSSTAHSGHPISMWPRYVRIRVLTAMRSPFQWELQQNLRVQRQLYCVLEVSTRKRKKPTSDGTRTRRRLRAIIL